MRGFLLALLCFSPALTFGAEEALGPTWPVTEPDMIQEIQKKLKSMERSGRLSELQKQAVERSRKSIERPAPAVGLRRTTTARTFYFDPTWTAPTTVSSPDGKIIVQAGEQVNPLDYVPLSNYLVFFNGDDAAQVRKAHQLITHYEGKVKAIMVAGEPLKLTRAWKRQIYFDQGGALVRRFGIQQVPALVSQEQKRIRIDEVLP